MEPVQLGNQRVDGGVEGNRSPAWNHQNQSKTSNGSAESEENVFVCFAEPIVTEPFQYSPSTTQHESKLEVGVEVEDEAAYY